MNHSTYTNYSKDVPSSKATLDAYPYVHVAIEKQVRSDENLLEALYVAGMPRTLVNRLASSFSRRLDD